MITEEKLIIFQLIKTQQHNTTTHSYKQSNESLNILILYFFFFFHLGRWTSHCFVLWLLINR